MITLFQRLWRFIKVRSAIRHAKNMNALTFKRYYVIQVLGEIRVYDRKHINFLIEKGILYKKLRSSYELRKFCLYVTK